MFSDGLASLNEDLTKGVVHADCRSPGGPLVADKSDRQVRPQRLQSKVRSGADLATKATLLFFLQRFSFRYSLQESSKSETA